MDDNEQHLIMIFCATILPGQNLIEGQIVAVIHFFAEVPIDLFVTEIHLGLWIFLLAQAGLSNNLLWR